MIGRLVLTGFFISAAIVGGAPLRVDINSEGRADMRTAGWENWKPTDDDFSETFGDVTVTLRASHEGGTMSLKGSKAAVVHGVTLGADGVVVTGGKPAGDRSPARWTPSRETHLCRLSPRAWRLSWHIHHRCRRRQDPWDSVLPPKLATMVKSAPHSSNSKPRLVSQRSFASRLIMETASCSVALRLM